MKILILGSNGQVGKCLNDQLVNTKHKVLYFPRHLIDIADFKKTETSIAKHSPDIVINASAYTAVDKAEINKEKANVINNLAVANLANISFKNNSFFIHISTDYVFDGSSETPYNENSQTNPKSVYGETKLKGEIATKLSGCKYIIIRTAWVFSEYGNNFLKTMLKLGTSSKELNIIGDQTGCPTYAQDLARSIVLIINNIDSGNFRSGLYNYCGDNLCSWFDFAKFIFKEAAILGLETPKAINSIKTSDYPTPAERPIFTALNCAKIKNDFDIDQSNWHEGVKESLLALVKKR